MRIAIIDIGTNSTRLLVSEIDDTGARTVHTGLITTRLGEGIGKEPYLLGSAIERTVDALLEFRQQVAQLGAAEVVAAATSAVRDAANRLDFLAQVKNRVGWDVRVLSGEEEAEMSYLGVVQGLQLNSPDPVVVDIGGGSTEFIWAGPKGPVFKSVRVGAVRMTERNCSREEIEKLLADLCTPVREAGLKNLVGVGGTLTTLAAMDQRLEIYEPSRIHGYIIKRERVKQLLAMMEEMSLDQRQQVAGLQPKRADIIVAGIRIALAVLEGVGADRLTVSETDIMYGLLYSVLKQKNIKFKKLLLKF